MTFYNPSAEDDTDARRVIPAEDVSLSMRHIAPYASIQEYQAMSMDGQRTRNSISLVEAIRSSCRKDPHPASGKTAIAACMLFAALAWRFGYENLQELANKLTLWMLSPEGPVGYGPRFQQCDIETALLYWCHALQETQKITDQKERYDCLLDLLGLRLSVHTPLWWRGHLWRPCAAVVLDEEDGQRFQGWCALPSIHGGPCNDHSFFLPPDVR